MNIVVKRVVGVVAEGGTMVILVAVGVAVLIVAANLRVITAVRLVTLNILAGNFIENLIAASCQNCCCS